MRIVSEDRLSFVEIEFEEAEVEICPSTSVAILVKNKGFRGINSGCWLEHNDIEKFINELKEIDMKRQEKAVLCTMTPDDFTLEIEVYNKSRHIKLRYSIRKHDICQYDDVELKGGFTINSSNFNSIVSDFEKLYKQR